MRVKHTTALGIISLLMMATAVAGGDFKSVYKTRPAETETKKPAPNTDPTTTVLRPETREKTGAEKVGENVTAVPPPKQLQIPKKKTPVAVTRGEDLLLKGKVAEAAKVFEKEATLAGTPAEQSSTLFRLGVQWQREAAEGPDAQRPEAIKAAASAYEQTLKVKPDSGPALNNLAQIYRTAPSEADKQKADELLARAIKLNDSHKSVYLLNRAELKLDARDFNAATEFAEQAAADDKGNLEAHRMVMKVALMRENAKPLLKYIEDLNSRGLVLRALDSAAEGIEKFPNERKQLLTSVARTISDSAYTADPWLMAETPAGQRIGKFSDDPTIGAGVKELFQVLHAPVPADSLKWWRDGFSAEEWPREGSPADAMQNLTRRCGEIYHQLGDERAEGYYRMGVDLNGRMNADARALLGLAEILYQQKRIDDLSKALAAYEPGMLDAKGVFISKADYLHTYELRIALGMMYGYVGRWKATTPPEYASSIWMLENAKKSAEIYNRQPGRKPEDRVKLPPSAVKMLSTGYAKSNELNRSVEERLRAAEDYLRSDQKHYAQLVLDSEWQRTLPANLDAALKQRLAQVTARASN